MLAVARARLRSLPCSLTRATVLVTFQSDVKEAARLKYYVSGVNSGGSAYNPRAGDALRPVCGKMGPP